MIVRHTDVSTAAPIEFTDAVRMVLSYAPGLEVIEGSDWAAWITDTYGRYGYGYSTDELPSLPQLWNAFQATRAVTA